jgi:malate dehydrogenase (oxaloacetate-decarboxylating)
MTGQAYDDFIDSCIRTIRKHLPHAYIHWEDFGRDNARRNLERYRHEFCTFNDDMQGTGAVALAAILAGIKAAGRQLHEERIVFLGAGTAGTGIADQLFAEMMRQGISNEKALQCFYLVDRFGLLVENSPDMTHFQRPYARSLEEIQTWNIEGDFPTLCETVREAKPTILIGCSSVSGAFNEKIIRTMVQHTHRPIILPLSNPTAHAEAHPQDLYAWSDGRALVATGSPFGEITYNDKKIRIAQCNNAFIFPGIGLGVIACRPKKLSDEIIWAAAEVLSEFSPVHQDKEAPLLPDLSRIREVSRAIAIRVIQVAREQQLATYQHDLSPEEAIAQVDWQPEYFPYEKCA